MKSLEIKQVLDVVRASGLSVPEVINLIKSQKKINPYQDFKLVVDYRKTFLDLVIDGGYYYLDSSVKKHFTIPRDLAGQEVVVSARMFHFEGGADSPEVIKHMTTAGYRPATDVEMLCLTALCPNLLREFPIAALGSVWKYLRITPYVVHAYRAYNRSYLEARRFSDIWHPSYHFLGIKI